MTFPVVIQLISVSFRNSGLFTLYPPSSSEQNKGAGRTVVLILAAS